MPSGQFTYYTKFLFPLVTVIARCSTSGSKKFVKSMFNEIIDQPLSLLAHHDEQDLINLSFTPLRPGDGPENNGN